MVSGDTFTAIVPKEIEEDSTFNEWLEDVDGSQLLKIEATIDTIEKEGLITNVKDLKDGLYEKKWANGLRMYFAVIEKNDSNKTLLLLGSGKGRDQNRAIAKAKVVLRNYKVINMRRWLWG